MLPSRRGEYLTDANWIDLHMWFGNYVRHGSNTAGQPVTFVYVTHYSLVSMTGVDFTFQRHQNVSIPLYLSLSALHTWKFGLHQ